MCEHVRVYKLIEWLNEEIEDLHLDNQYIQHLKDGFNPIDRVVYDSAVSDIIDRIEELVRWLRQQLKHIGELEEVINA